MAESTRHDVGAFVDHPDGEARKVVLDGIAISLVRIEDDIYAVGDICSHAKVSLSEGFVEPDDCSIECPKHGASFNLETGEALTLPAVQPVPVFDAEVVDGHVFVTISRTES